MTSSEEDYKQYFRVLQKRNVTDKEMYFPMRGGNRAFTIDELLGQ